MRIRGEGEERRGEALIEWQRTFPTDVLMDSGRSPLLMAAAVQIPSAQRAKLPHDVSPEFGPSAKGTRLYPAGLVALARMVELCRQLLRICTV